MIGNPKKITSQPVVPQAKTIFWHIPNSSNSYVFGIHYHKHVVDLPSLGVFLIQTAVTVDTVVPCLTAGFSSFIALPW